MIVQVGAEASAIAAVTDVGSEWRLTPGDGHAWLLIFLRHLA